MTTPRNFFYMSWKKKLKDLIAALIQGHIPVRCEITKIIFPRKVKFPEKYKNAVNLQEVSLCSHDIVCPFKGVRKHKKEHISPKVKKKNNNSET